MNSEAHQKNKTKIKLIKTSNIDWSKGTRTTNLTGYSYITLHPNYYVTLHWVGGSGWTFPRSSQTGYTRQDPNKAKVTSTCFHQEQYVAGKMPEIACPPHTHLFTMPTMLGWHDDCWHACTRYLIETTTITGHTNYLDCMLPDRETITITGHTNYLHGMFIFFF